MAMTVAELEAWLTLKDEMSPSLRVAADNARKAADEINVGLVSVSDSASQTGVAMTAMGNVVTSVVLGLSGKFMGLTREMVSLGAQHQNLTTVSRYMTSQQGLMAGETDRLAEALNRQGISLVRARDAIIQMSRANLDLAKAEDLGAVAQSAARLAGANSSETLQRLIFGIQTLQPEVLRTSGIIVNLEKAYGDLALSLGKSTQALTGNEKQQAAMNAVLTEGAKIAGVYAETNKSVAGMEQSLKRHRDDALTMMGKELIPLWTEWIGLQKKLYVSMLAHPQLYLAIGAALAALAIKMGASYLGIGKWISGIYSAGKAALVFAAEMAISTKAQLASNAAQQQAILLNAMPKARQVGFGSFAPSAAVPSAAGGAMKVGRAAAIGASINAVGTQAAGMAAAMTGASGATATLTGALSLLGVALAVPAAFFAGFSLGNFIKELKVGGVAIEDWRDAVFAMGSQGGVLTEAGRQAFKDAVHMAETTEQLALVAEQAAKRQAKMREELEKTPNNQMRDWIKDYKAMMESFVEDGAATADQLRGAVKKIETQLDRAIATGIDPKYIAHLRNLLASVNAELLSAEISELKELAPEMNALSAATGTDAQQGMVRLAATVAGFSEEAKNAVPWVKELVAAVEAMPKIVIPQKPDDGGKPGGPEAAARAKLRADILQKTEGEQQAGMLKDLTDTAGPQVLEMTNKIKALRGAKDANTLSTQNMVAVEKKWETQTKANAKAATAMALSLKGWVGKEQIEKLSTVVAKLGGASEMTAEQTLKVGKSLAEAVASGQPLPQGLQDVAASYGAVAAQQEILAAKGGLAASTLKDMGALFTSVAAAGAVPTEMVMKYGEALYNTQQAGVTLAPVLADVAAEWAKMSSADQAFIAAGGMSAKAMQEQEQKLKKLAEAGQLTVDVIKQHGPAALAAADAGQTLGRNQADVAESFKLVSAEMQVAAAKGLLTDKAMEAMSQTFVALEGNIPVELLERTGEALWRMHENGKLADAGLQQQLKDWLQLKGEQAAGVGAEAAGNKPVALQEAIVKQLMSQDGGLAKLGTEALLTLLKSVQAATANAKGEFVARGQQIQGYILSGLAGAEGAGLAGAGPVAMRAYEAFFKGVVDQQKALGTAEGLSAAGEAAWNLADVYAKMKTEGLLTADAIALIDANQIESANSAMKWGSMLAGVVGLAGMLGGKLGDIAQIVGNIGDQWARIGDMPSPETALKNFQAANPTMTGSTQNALGTGKTGQQLFDETQANAKKAKLVAKIGAGAQAAGAIGGMLNQGTGNQQIAGKALQGAAAGAQMGAVAGPMGMAAGAIIGGVIGFMKGAKIKKQAKEAGKALGMEISEELLEQIKATADKFDLDIAEAALLNLSSAMDESKKSAAEFAPQVTDLMKGIADGSLPAKEALEQVGQAFTKIADEAMLAGRVGSREMVALIKNARALNIESPEIDAFVGEQLDLAVAGVHKFVGAIKLLDKEWLEWVSTVERSGDAALGSMEEIEGAITSLGEVSGVVFGAMFSALIEEKGIVGAVDAMAEDFNSLKESLTESLGEAGMEAILGSFGAAFDTINDEHLRPLFEGIDGLSQAMKGLANAGYLSTEQFSAMQSGIGDMFDLAVAGGADMNTALLAVSPAIQAAISAAEEFGIPLDADTQRLKDLAEQNGITFSSDPQRAMLDVLVEIAKVMGADIPESAQRMRDGIAGTTTAITEQGSAFSSAQQAGEAAMRDARDGATGTLDIMTTGLKAYGDAYEEFEQNAVAGSAAASGAAGAVAGAITAQSTAYVSAQEAGMAAYSAARADGEGLLGSIGAAHEAYAEFERSATSAAAATVAGSAASVEAVREVGRAALDEAFASGETMSEAVATSTAAMAAYAEQMAAATGGSVDSLAATAVGIAAATEVTVASIAGVGTTAVEVAAQTRAALMEAHGASAEEMSAYATEVAAATGTALASMTGETVAALDLVEGEGGGPLRAFAEAGAAASGAAEEWQRNAAASASAASAAIVATGSTAAEAVREVGRAALDEALASGASLSEAVQIATDAMREGLEEQVAASGDAVMSVADATAVALDEAAMAAEDMAGVFGNDVPTAVQQAALSFQAMFAALPDDISIPVSFPSSPIPGGPGGPDGPDPREFAGGSGGWQNFGAGTPAVLHGTEAVVRPGDPALPGQAPAGPSETHINLNINENPMQTAETVEQMRRFTLDAVQRELARDLASQIADGTA